MRSEAMQNFLREMVASPTGLETFYRRHVEGVTRFLARRCRTPEDLADAVSATFVAVLVSARSYDPDLGSPTAWLFSIARNEARGQGRTLGRREALRHRLNGRALLSSDDTDRLIEMIETESRVAQLEDTLRGASVGELELLHTMVAQDATVSEASSSLGISSATGRKRLERFRRRVPDELKAPIYDSFEPANNFGGTMNTLTQFDPREDFEDRLLDELFRVQSTFVNVVTIRHRRLVWGYGVLAAAAAIVVAVVLQVAPSPVNAPQTASAATELHRLSVVASSQPANALEPGQYVYTESVSNSGPAHLSSGYAFNVDFLWTRQFWVAPDGSGHGVFTASNVTFPSPADRAAWVAQGSPNVVSMLSGASTFGPGDYGPMGINEFTLPTDQSQLSQVIASHLASVTNVRLGSVEYAATEFNYIGSLLQETAAPPTVQAALLALARSLPGITLVGPDAAPDGVAGVGIELSSGNGSSHELIFNPSTGALVAQEDWSTDSSGARTLARWTSYVAGGVVDNTSTTSPVMVPLSSASSS